MKYENSPNHHERITSGIEAAEDFKAVIDTYTAKLIADAVTMDCVSATKKFARTGSIQLEPLLVEMHEAAERKGASEYDKKLYTHLGTYAITAGERAPVPGWHEIEDNGPAVPPGYFGTYPSLEDFCRDIGFRVIALADGRVHVFQNPEQW